MAEFNVDDYFAQQRASAYGIVDNTPPESSAKKQSLIEARQRKLQALEAAGARRQRNMEESYVGRLAQLGLDPDGQYAGLVNTAAEVQSGLSKGFGHLLSLPLTGVATVQELGTPEEVQQAYNRYQRGELGPATRQPNMPGVPYNFNGTDVVVPRLDSQGRMLSDKEAIDQYLRTGVTLPTQPAETRTPEQVDRDRRDWELLNQKQDLLTTNLQGLENARALRETAGKVRDAFDISSIIWDEARTDLGDDLNTPEVQGDLDRLKQAGSRIAAGDVLGGLDQGITSLALLMTNAVEAGANNPAGVKSYLAENIPQLVAGGISRPLMAGLNIGYASDTFSQGIEAYQQANGGALPPKDEQYKMAAYAVSLAAAEQLGDVSLLRGLGRTAGEAAEGTQEAATRSFKDALLNTGRAGVTGAATEAVTEGYQTFAEGEITGNPATAQEIYAGAAIGGLIGGGISTGLTGLSEAGQLASTTEEVPIEQPAAEVSAVQQIAGLMQASRQADATPEAKTENLEQATQVVSDLESRYADAQDAYEITTPEGMARTEQQIQAVRQRMDKIDPADTPRLEQFQQLIETMEADLIEARELTPQQVKQRQQAMEKLGKEVEAARTVKDRLAIEVQPAEEDLATQVELADSTPAAEDTEAVAKAKTAAERVLTLTMRSPERFEPETLTRLADNTANQLSEPQRQYLRQLSATRIAENQAKGLEQVNLDILEGNSTERYKGIKQYRAKMAEALSGTGNQKVARRELSQLKAFAREHAQKARVATQAWGQVRLGGGTTQWVRASDGQWQPAQQQLSSEELKANGGIQINGRSFNLVEAIRAEATALHQAARELQAAYDLKFNTPVQQTTPAAPIPVAEASPAGVPQAESTPAVVDNTQAAAPAVEPIAENVPQPAPQATVEEETAPATPETVETVAETEAAVTNSPEIDTDPVISEEAQSENDLDALVAAENQEQEAAAEPEIQPGRLSVFDQVQKTEENLSSAQAYQRSNLITRYFTQKAGKEGSKSLRPLVLVKNFRNALVNRQVKLRDYLDLQEISEEQQELVKFFFNTARRWEPLITANLFRREAKDQAFFYQNYNQFLFNKDGSVDENVKTAIAYAAFSWTIENASQPTNSDEDINAILNRDDDYPIDALEERWLREAGTRDKVVMNNLGQRVVQALGLQAKNDAPLSEMPRLEAALGVQVLALLERVGIVERHEIPADVMTGLMTKPNANETNEISGEVVEATPADELGDRYFFVRMAKQNGQVSRTAEEIREKAVGSQGILGNLFGVEERQSEPSFEPVPFLQRFARRTFQRVPKTLAEILNREGSKPYFLRQDMWHVWGKLEPRTLEILAGVQHADLRIRHKTKVDSQRAKNESLQREVNRFNEFAQKMLDKGGEGLERALYFGFSVWKPQRVGINANAINPQTGKVHRHMLFKKGWDITIRLDDKPLVNSFKLRVAEGLGIKTDKMSNAAALAKYEDLMAKPVFQRAVQALRKALYEDAPLNATEQNALIDAVKAGGENFHSLDVLVNQAHYEQANASGATEFTTQLMGEVDGVTNGPMISQLALGSADFSELNRGGFFSLDDEQRQYNLWRSQAGNLDLYESTMSSVIRGLGFMVSEKPKREPVVKALYRIAGNGKALFEADPNDPDNKFIVTSTGRKLIKTPLTAMMFGSGLGTAVSNMADDFVDTYYVALEAMANGDRSPTELRQLLIDMNTLISYGNRKERGLLFNVNTPLDKLMQRELTKGQIEALQKAFRWTIGKQVQKTLKSDFALFIARRQVFNKAAQLSFRLYDTVYTYLRDKALQEQLQTGGVATRETKQGPEAIHDLTREQEGKIRQQLARMAPVLHTAMSQASKDLGAGLYLAKTGRQLSQKFTYQNQVRLGQGLRTRMADGKVSEPTWISTAGYERTETDPGVRPLILSTHSTDSAISHNALDEGDVLNIHDAHGAGVADVAATARRLNEQTFRQLLEYSAPDQVYQTLRRTLNGVSQLLKNGQADDGLKQALAQVVKEVTGELNEDEVPVLEQRQIGTLEYLTEQVKATMFRAEQDKLTHLRRMASVDQYAFEGGAYTVTDADRQAAQARLEGLTDEIDVNLRSNTRAIDLMVSEVLQATPMEVWQQAEEAKQKAMEEKMKRRRALREEEEEFTSPASASMLEAVDQAIKVAPAEQQTALVKVRDRMLERNQDWLTSASEALSVMDAGEAIHAVRKFYEPNMEHPLGPVGPSQFVSDPVLVAVLQERPDMSAHALLQRLRFRIEKQPKGRSYDFQMVLVEQLERTIPLSVRVHYVTPDSDPEEVLGEGYTKARGWYAAKQGTERLYIKSPDFVHAGVTTELLLHELTHAALARVVENATDGEAKALVDELERLRQKASEILETDPRLKQEYSNAVANVHELISWGMTNAGFQREVLNNPALRIQSRTRKTGLVSAMKAFVETVTDLLFRGTSKSKRDLQYNGMRVLIHNVAGLFEEAARSQQAATEEMTLPMQSPDPVTQINKLSTLQLYDALGQAGSAVGSTFDGQLRSLLNGIVRQLHGPWGATKAIYEQDQALTPVDQFLKSMASGQLPFASRTLAAGFKISDQEAFVLEQVEVTVRAALDDTTTTAYRELAKLYREARRWVKPEDFYAGDWSQASEEAKATAQAQWNHVFLAEQNGDLRSDYLSRFAAMGLAYQPFNELLQHATARDTRSLSDMSWPERLRAVFERILELLASRLTNTYGGQQGDQKLTTLIGHLVDIEAKKRRTLSNRRIDTIDQAEAVLGRATEGLRRQVDRIASSATFKGSKNGFVRMMGALPSAAVNDRLGYMLEGLQRIREREFGGRQGVAATLLSEARGATSATQYAHPLLRAAKHHENERKDIKTDIQQLVLNSFANEGRDLSPETKAALSKVLLRADLQALLDQHTLPEIADLVGNPVRVQQLIEEQELAVRQLGNYRHYYLKAAKQLGYFKATGQVRGENLMANAFTIGLLTGTGEFGKVTPAQARQVAKVLDPLISLYALQYTDKPVKDRAFQVMRQEQGRGTESGVELTLKLHRELQQQSAERLFEDSEALMFKGYVPEIFNPYTEVLVAGGQDAERLEAMGYAQGPQLKKDPADPDQDVQFLYTIRDRGLRSQVSGIFSYTGQNTRGNRLHGGVTDFLGNQGHLVNQRTNARIAHQKAAVIARMFQVDSTYDPSKDANGTRMMPVVNAKGEIVNYRYMMSEHNKDTLLERNDRFDEVLGTLASSIYDKETSKAQNEVAIKALHEQYQEEYAQRPEAYVMVGPDSPDAEARETYRLLPETARQQIREVWGDNNMMVRADLLDIAFGYRKPSLSTVFEKTRDERSAMEQIFTHFVEAILLPFGDQSKAALRVRQAEEIWQAVVAEAKDILVVKTGLTLLGNIQSNISQLVWAGVPVTDIVRHHRIALKGVVAYREDVKELRKLQALVDAEAVGDLPEARQRIIELEDAIARSPVRELIEAGLMPTIVEDVADEQDPFSYKGRLVRKVENITRGLPEGLRTVGKTLYMAHDTPLYRVLSQGTQLSDFVARYTLYQHLVSRRKNPLPSQEAIQQVSEAFVNYDLPTHRGVQYLNDMGVLMFTKYYIRIQKVILQLYRENPARAMLMLTLGSFYAGWDLLTDSAAINHVGNPLNMGALGYPSTLDELATVKMGMAVFGG